MAVPTKPDERLTRKALAEPLRRAIQATFAAGLTDCALVGGTALAGYYACHRTSDDMDLFTGSETAQALAVAAVKNLKEIGAVFAREQAVPTYYHADLNLSGYAFTADVVLDKRLHQIGAFIPTPSGVLVADLATLFKMKVAALVSRCSEKDLYDLLWIAENSADPDISEWLRLGREVDNGLSAETALISLTMADLKPSACSFAEKFGVSATEVHARITKFRAQLQRRLADYLDETPADPKMQALVRKLRKHR
jgi:hypothetical protein